MGDNLGLLRHTFSRFAGEDHDQGRGKETSSLYGSETMMKVFVVMIQPTRQIHRQVDIIVCPPKDWITCVIGWTGSTQYERSLRLFVKKNKKLHFTNHGLFDLKTRKKLSFNSQDEFYEFIGAPNLLPEDRNA